MRAVLLAMALAAPAAQASPMSALGELLASPEMTAVTDRTLAGYVGPALSVAETHAGDCGATMRITSGTIHVRTALLALRRVADCSGPKPILALRLTVDQPGASDVIEAMRKALPKPCFEGAGAQGAPSVVWSDPARLVGVVQDKPPGSAFSVFWVNQSASGSSDAASERMLRRLMEADLPPQCLS